jgi:hypothetical protein
MLKVGIVLATLVASLAIAQNQPISQFEIARHTFFDFGPPNDYYELFLVRSTQSGSTVEKITLIPSIDSCFQPAKAEIAETAINQTIPELLGKTDPCTIPAKELRREKKRCKKCLVVSGANVSMLAHCGTQSRTIRADILDRDMFDPAVHTPEHASWTMKLLSQLDQAAGPNVMDRPMFPTLNEESKSTPIPESQTLRDIGSGKYDDLFRGAPDKPSDLYRAAQIKPIVPIVHLLSSTPFQPESFVQPDYPPIAKLAHLNGAVSFTVDVNADGSTANFAAESGGKWFFAVTEQATNRWKFSPNAAGQKIHALVEFKTNCPGKP